MKALDEDYVRTAAHEFLYDRGFPEATTSVRVERGPVLTTVRIEIPEGSQHYAIIRTRGATVSGNGWLRIVEDRRGHGIGARLVLAREDLCELLDAEAIIIGRNTNRRGFWQDLGYEPVPDGAYDGLVGSGQLLLDGPGGSLSTPAHKLL